jgi:hypothetical protein
MTHSIFNPTGLQLVSNDTLATVDRPGIPPFGDDAQSTTLSEPPANERSGAPRILNHTRLAQLRKSPVARLLTGSHWVLKTWQLDLEFPPSIRAWVDQRLSDSLNRQYGTKVDLDTVHIDFTTQQDPAVNNRGEERFDLRLSLRELARTALDPSALSALQQCVEPDRPLHYLLSGLTAANLFQLLKDNNWTDEYARMLRQFWRRHGTTWQLLARLSFLDGLHRLQKRKQISADGYRLALNALGLTAFPKNLQALRGGSQNRRSMLHGVMLNGEIIPGIFHLKSNNTGHCYIHVLGDRPRCFEYISDHAAWNRQKILDALNASPWHRLHLNTAQAPNRLELGAPIKDLFSCLCTAQQRFSIDRLDAATPFESLDDVVGDEEDVLLMPIRPALALISTLDHWRGEARIQQRIPTLLGQANKIMGKWLKRKQGRELNPEHVFVRYLPGTSQTPWGAARIPANNIIVVPDEQPTALGQALINNFREQYPSGYDDHGGRWVVYIDSSGQGIWSPDQELPITAASIEAQIRSVEFLEVMTRQLKRFWEQQAVALEQSLWATLIGQSLLSLKTGDLSVSGFDLLVSALHEQQEPDVQRESRWSVLGFYLPSGLLPGTDCPVCAGLLLLRNRDKPGGILYQAGQQRAFVEFSTHLQLTEHLRYSAADEQWRKTLLNYMPVRFHSSLSHVLELWGDITRPPDPVSMLRPWTDRIYNEAAHLATSHEGCEQDIQQSPVAFLLERLRRNSLDDAEDAIVTHRERVISVWTQQVDRLRLLLAPLALLLPAVAIASLAASAVSLTLNIQAAMLPGPREAERRQVMVAILSLGLLQLGPATPRLLRAFSRFSNPAKLVNAARSGLPLRTFGDWLQRTTRSRQTVLTPFFNGVSPLKNWRVPGSAAFGTDPVRVWKLGRKFLLWTSDRTQARALVVSSHGYYLPWTRTTAIPNGTELRTYAPHGYALIDPELHKVVSQTVKPYATLSNAQLRPGSAAGPFTDMVEGNRLMAGTLLPGQIKNYSLSKFQSQNYESYRDISRIIGNNNRPLLPSQVPAVPMDVLTVRNRFGMTSPTLEDLFAELHRQGIHYDKVLLVHCRCSIMSALLGRAPTYDAPVGPAPVTP